MASADPLRTPEGQSIYYVGPSLTEERKPAVIFFALSAKMTLHQDPFNQPALALAEQGIRVFSWDLPFHEQGKDPHEAMHHWAKEFAHNSHFVSDYIQLCKRNIQFLIDKNLIDPSLLAVAGLSRGGFIAAHLAAQERRIRWVLGFAPLTRPEPLEEFKVNSSQNYEDVALIHLVDQLSDTHVRFYIGNHDIRVQTHACYLFIKELTDRSFERGIRSPLAELIIYPSIGHRGHGTPPHIFSDGANWLKNQLLNRELL